MHAGRLQLVAQPFRTHVALAHDAVGLVVARHFVRALPDAILAPYALVVEVLYDAGDGVFFIGADGASMHAFRIHTVMACTGDGLYPLLTLIFPEPLMDSSP